MNAYNTPFQLFKKSVLFMLAISFLLFLTFEFILYRIGEIGDYENIIILEDDAEIYNHDISHYKKIDDYIKNNRFKCGTFCNANGGACQK